MFFELEAVPQIITKSREQYEGSKEELLREYQAFLRFLLTRFSEVHLVFASQGPFSPVRIGYNIRCQTRAEFDNFLRYLRTLRKYLKFRDAGAEWTTDLRQRRGVRTVILDRRADLVLVGGMEESGVTRPELLPLTAGKPLQYNPQIVVGGWIDAILNTPKRFLAQVAKETWGLDKPYLAAVTKEYLHHGGPRQWHNVLAVLRHTADVLTLRCRRYDLSSESAKGDIQYALLSLSYFLAAMQERLDRTELNKRTALYRSLISRQPVYEVEVELSASNDVGFEALGRDTDPELFEKPQDSLLREQLTDRNKHAEGYTRLFTMNEVVGLLCPPYTFRDALTNVKHFVPKPFHVPYTALDGAKTSISLGALDDGESVCLHPDTLTRHVFITGTTGSGKTNTIKHLVDQLLELQKPLLIIDPVKRDFEHFVLNRGVSSQHIYDFGPAPNSNWLRFNPFIPPPRTSLYSHSVVLAKTLSILFPNNPVGFDILLQMVRQVYSWAYELESKKTLNPADFHKLTGADLWGQPSLAPTFEYFLGAGLHVVRGAEIAAPPDDSEIAGNSGDSTNRYLSQYTIETLEHFQRQFENLRRSALAQVFSPTESDDGQIADLFGSAPTNSLERRCRLIQLYSWQDEREVNALCALLFAMLYEQRQSDYAELATAQGALPLIHVTIIDEAHRIFAADQRSGDERLISPAREIATLMSHMMAELRALGQGIIVSEQSASKIHPDALVNSATKIIHGIGFGKDKEAVASALSLSAIEQDYLSYLRAGEAVAMAPGVSQPLYINVPNKDLVPAPPSAITKNYPCYVSLFARPDDTNKFRLLNDLLSELHGDSKRPKSLDLRIVSWTPTDVEPQVTPADALSNTRPILHPDVEFGDLFEVLLMDVRRNRYTEPIFILMLGSTLKDNLDSIVTGLKELKDFLGVKWIVFGFGDAAFPEDLVNSVSAAVKSVRSVDEIHADACKWLVSTVDGLMTPSEEPTARLEDVPDGITVIKSGSVKATPYRQQILDLLNEGKLDAAELMLGIADPEAEYDDLHDLLSKRRLEATQKK